MNPAGPPQRRVRWAAGVNAPRRPASIPRPPDRHRTFTAVVSWAAPAALIVIVGVLLQQAWPSVTRFGLGFFVGTEWNQVPDHFRALPFIFATLPTSAVALLLSPPSSLPLPLLSSH